MNQKKIWLGMLVMALAFGMTVVGCDDSSTGGGDGVTSAYLGDTLDLSGQVYLERWNDDYTNVNYQNFTGNLTIPEYVSWYDYDDDDNKEEIRINIGGSGEIRNGRLSYSIGTPNELDTFDEWDYIFYKGPLEDVKVSDANVKGFVLEGLDVDSDDYSGLMKEKKTVSSGTYEFVNYVYVESDVTVSGKSYKWAGGQGTRTFKKCVFKKGWNAVYQQNGETKNTVTISTSMGNPSSLRWVLYEKHEEEDDDW